MSEPNVVTLKLPVTGAASPEEAQTFARAFVALALAYMATNEREDQDCLGPIFADKLASTLGLPTPWEGPGDRPLPHVQVDTSALDHPLVEVDDGTSPIFLDDHDRYHLRALQGAWITAWNVSLHLLLRDGQVCVAAYPLNHEMDESLGTLTVSREDAREAMEAPE